MAHVKPNRDKIFPDFIFRANYSRSHYVKGNRERATKSCRESRCFASDDPLYRLSAPLSLALAISCDSESAATRGIKQI
jgi:hypothetical protein